MEVKQFCLYQVAKYLGRDESYAIFAGKPA